MKTVDIPRFMIVGTGSGCGKTTITCGILKAIQNRGYKLASFKMGPDYIDPMFHSTVIGTKSRNLDLFMCSEAIVKYLFEVNSQDTDFSVIEGVMGIYDGVNDSDECSSNHLSLIADIPQILIVSPKGMSLSVVAQIYGYLNFKKNNIRGIILNRVTESMYKFYRDMIERELNIKVYGYMPEIKEAVFESRHLGLITADEIINIQDKISTIAEMCEKTIDIDLLIELGNTNKAFTYDDNISITNILSQKSVKIAISRDKAFCFYYEDNITLLKKLGADIVFFSPLNDKCLPKDVDGIIICGGYPEEYASKLSQNISMHESIKEAVRNNTPIIAECGGFMYLCKELVDKQNISYEMVGVIDSIVRMTDRLSRFGYITITANCDNLLCQQSEKINTHEFHYSDSTNNGSTFTAKKLNGKLWDCIHSSETMFIGYPHIHFWSNIKFAEKFIKKCEALKK